MTVPPEGHGLGPHVVGRRVVVRRVLPGRRGPTGGPAMTDLLGICLAWADGECVVQPDQGAAVRIPLAEIVSGKPVPPRPPVRHRVTPREAQRRAMSLFPDLLTEPLGDWVLRRSPTVRARRANSVLAFGPSGVDDDLQRVVAFYDRPVAAVLPDSAEDALFRSHGWGPESGDADTVFQLAGVARALRRPPGPAQPERGTAEVVEDPSGLATARVTVDGRTAAVGIGARDGDWLGIRGIEVAPEHRRRGLASAALVALLGWGAEQGATTAYLQVLGGNRAALALYERFGFATHHTYRYLAAPAR